MESIFLHAALEQASLGQGNCAPNPAVGAVLVKNNAIIARGFHRGVGTDHAEVDALNKVSGDLHGTTLFVTLEPCCHVGKTPPCTQAIIKRGVSRVVYAYKDPNHHTDTSGEAVLTAAGILCEHHPLPEINQFYEAYHHFILHKRPFITAKLAMSLDAKIAGKGGQPVKITGEKALKFTHQQRQYHNAILTTAKTIIADDSRFNVRKAGETFKKDLYVLDRQLTLPLNAKIFETTKSMTVFYDEVLSSPQKTVLEGRGVTCVPVPCKDNQIDLHTVLAYLGLRGIHSLWVESGALSFSSFLQENLVQRAYIYVASHCLGDAAVPAFSKTFNFDKVRRFKKQMLGNDVCWQWEF